MQRFSCPSCSNELHFDNLSCIRCGTEVAYDVDSQLFIDIQVDGANLPCANRVESDCNWQAEGDHAFCRACRHNRTVPDLGLDENRDRWRRIERAKRLLFYSLLKWRLPLSARDEVAGTGLTFDFLADEIMPDGTTQPVLSGHSDGVITLNIAEGDDAERERRRTTLGEPYRTLIGHLRHEIGHYFWDVLVRDGSRLDEFRCRFGDERVDYGDALKRHYANGPAEGWQQKFISGYASAHPWEDFAETWAHYLHIIDTLETAHAFQLHYAEQLVTPGRPRPALVAVDFDPYRRHPWSDILDRWIPLTIAINALNRSLGQADLYPFALSPAAMAKLEYVHALIGERPPPP